ncbi:MAG: malonyl-[acyl-carrier protein] O-methyltransferase BioC [Hydrogenophilales bacterium CG_4_8_14_3_um_filter_62_83]|nr:malonyl-ACP O-methyltransferase BioC [Betaproteobacteria bacterium]PIX01154.1 MAG: malonyl-[acyl-carrier protein] O-methyltransferase BioC [Hydrogenophilales bacterium CG_4_8_14_3_um_filter_62_83]PIY98206.1 MAG: malonyl-[acyl-carrier protein] O-methyltransferase BioC [Hydrogenophilales bacterium CG_4_10_14_0_8_um_filter_62_70]
MKSALRQTLRAAFDRAAPTYDDAAFLQQEVARRLDERLAVMKLDPVRILDAGCGTGFAFPLLNRRYPKARLVGLDLAHAMLTEARRRLPRPSLFDRLRTPFAAPPMALVGADIEALPLATDSLDLIWSNLAMQWLETPDTAFRELRRVLKPGGLLLFSSFGPDTLRELSAAFAGLDGYRHVNRFIDLHDLGDALMHAGFANPVMEMEYLTLTYADLKGVLRDLKGIGAHTVLDGRRQGLMGRREWQQLVANYETFRHDGRLPATYEVIYGHAWVGDKTPWDDGRKVIQLKIEQRQAGLR